MSNSFSNSLIRLISATNLFISSINCRQCGRVVKHRVDDQHGVGSKPTCAIPLCSWERHFTVLSPAWWSWQAVLN